MNRPDPLTAEERELTRLLGRGSVRTPPAALDEAILAAARQAASDAGAPAAGRSSQTTAASPPPPARRARRLPAFVGVAASVVFAIGIAWQLRPDPPPVPAGAGNYDLMNAPEPMQGPDVPQARAAASDTAQPASARQAPAALPEGAPAQGKRAAAPVPAEPSTAEADAVAAPVSSALPAAPDSPLIPAPPAPTAPQMAPAAPSRSARAQADIAAAPAAAPVPPPAAAPAASQEGTETSGGSVEPVQRRMATAAAARQPRAAVQPLSAADARAEVDADAALTRRQWLQKIRERRDAGSTDLARASLERYLRTYPETRLPSDLRTLLDQ